MKGVFITGTDTGSGKTHVTLGLMRAMKVLKMKVCGMKPVATGCARTIDGLRNEDAILIQKQCSRLLPYSTINPAAFEVPCSPNIAATLQGTIIQIDKISQAYEDVSAEADFVVVEGIGGWRVPLTDSIQTRDIVCQLDLPVIVVVGVRLGCISHALLTIEAIRNDNCAMAGWVANQLDQEYEYPAQTIRYLKSVINEPFLGEIPFVSDSKSNGIDSYLHIMENLL